MRVAVYPGSFNPLTIAHLAIAEAAWSQADVDRVDLVLSRVPLAKEDVDRPLLEDRLAVLREVAAARPWLGVRVTDDQLLADIAHGAALLVVGADKWAQMLDPRFYGGSASARDAALARLPRVAVVPRPGYAVPDDALVLSVASAVAEVSSTAARAGRHEWLAPEAAAFDAATGAWSDPGRYERVIADRL